MNIRPIPHPWWDDFARGEALQKYIKMERKKRRKKERKKKERKRGGKIKRKKEEVEEEKIWKGRK